MTKKTIDATDATDGALYGLGNVEWLLSPEELLQGGIIFASSCEGHYTEITSFGSKSAHTTS